MVDLTGPKIRLARANRHINDLEHLCNSFVCENPFRIVCEPDPDTQNVIIRTIVDRQLPIESSAIIGDAIHNLRSILDHLAYLAVVTNGSTPKFSTKFPTADTNSGLNGEINKCLVGASANFVKYVRSLKPYRDAGDGVLFNLARLNNIDKHRTILATTAVHEIHNVTITSEDGRFTGNHPIVSFVGNGIGRVNFIALPPNTKLNVQSDPNPTFHICFDNTEIVDGRPVLDTLRLYLQRCKEVVDNVIF